jgi:hypothetical protein
LSRLHSDDFDLPFEKLIQKKHFRYEEKGTSHKKIDRVIYDNQNFKCRQCGFFVTASRKYSGVNNRNHCPFCLWSWHVDLQSPGDRKADCRSRMEPIGLTVKELNKKYGKEDSGELMLIHRCTRCDKLSINRIAADDNIRKLHYLYLESLELDQASRVDLAGEGIRLLGTGDSIIVLNQLFGCRENFSELIEIDVRKVADLVETR